MPESLTYTYTTQAEVERCFSATGVTLRLDDLSGSRLKDFWTDLIAEITDFFNQYVEHYYEPSDLVNSAWVRSRAKWVGAYYLSMRRGNPSLFLERYEQIEQELRDVYTGVISIPRMPTRADYTPALSNLVVDPWYPTRQLRVRPEVSTGGSSPRQDVSFRYPWDWL